MATSSGFPACAGMTKKRLQGLPGNRRTRASGYPVLSKPKGIALGLKPSGQRDFNFFSIPIAVLGGEKAILKYFKR